MDSPNKTLVINDQLEGLETALGKAALIEHYTGCEVEVAEVIWDHIEEEPIPDQDKANLIEAFVAADRHGLQNLLEPYQDRIAWSEARVLWNKRADEGILQEVNGQHIDLLIKPAGAMGLGAYLNAPLDWRLIREAACPVLISKSNSWQTGGTVLGAVDIADDAHEALSRGVLRAAHLMAQILNAELHIVCVYSDLGQSVNALQVAMDYEGIKQDMRQARQDHLLSTLEELGIEGAELHVLEGKPPQVISRLAEELDATVTVMGTAARKGLGKLLIGNTAEDTLSLLPGDILTVRVTN
jgi:universal stress protein E